MQLVFAEKKSLAKAIREALGGECPITNMYGHAVRTGRDGR